jgi:hypothetical protein
MQKLGPFLNLLFYFDPKKLFGNNTGVKVRSICISRQLVLVCVCVCVYVYIYIYIYIYTHIHIHTHTHIHTSVLKKNSLHMLRWIA